MTTELSAEIDRDYLPEFNRMLPLPADDPNQFCDEDRRIALNARLRLWRSGPADGPELRAAIEAEVTEAIERGTLDHDDRTLRIDRVAKLLSGDASIADPPDADEVAAELTRGRERFAQVHRPQHELSFSSMAPVPDPDRHGNWPGVRWREAVEYSLQTVWDRRPRKVVYQDGGPRTLPPTTSARIAILLLRREKMNEAAATAAAEARRRRDSAEAAAAAVPIVFEDERQQLLRSAAFFWGQGDLVVPVTGHHLAEAKLHAELARDWNVYGLSDNECADVATELIRFVASQRALARENRVVPTIGYAVVVDGHGNAVDVAPGTLRLTIEGGQHVLRSPRWPRSVRLSSRDFRDWKRCAQAIYDQVGVEVDYPRGHWKRWWPSLASQLLKTVEVVPDAQRHMTWKGWLQGIAEAAPKLSHATTDGSAYWATTGELFVGKGWALAQAIEQGVIGNGDVSEFSQWLGKTYKNRRDAEGVQRKLLALPANRPLVLGLSREGGHAIEVASSNDVNEAENQGRNSATPAEVEAGSNGSVQLVLPGKTDAG